MKLRQLARKSRVKVARSLRKRRTPHDTLSVKQLRRRLYHAGASSADASRIAKEVKAGPSSVDELIAGGEVVLGWPRSALAARYGGRLTRAITKFVRRRFFMPDEFSQLVASHEFAGDLRNFVNAARRQWRKTPLIRAERSIAQFGIKFPAGMSYTVLTAPTRQGASVSTWLTAEDEAALNEWAAAQAPDAARGGAVDLMQWPGWSDVLARRAASRSIPGTEARP